MAVIIPLHENNYIASDIGENDELVVGGAMFNSSYVAALKADFSALAEVLGKFSLSYERSDMAQLTEWAKTLGLKKTPPDLFADLYMAQRVFEKHARAHIGKNDFERAAFYTENRPAKFSSAYEKSQMMCAENSLFLYKALRERGMKVFYVSGALVGRDVKEDDEAFSEPHAFLIIDDPRCDHVFIYDPSQALSGIDNAVFPSVLPVQRRQFEAWRDAAKSGAAYMEAFDELSGAKKYYGASSPNLSFFPRQIVRMAPETAAPAADNI